MLLVPNYVQIETTTRCNYRCSFCPHKSLKRPIADMDFSLFREIVDELHFLWKGRHDVIICPFINGELFADSKIFERLEYINKQIPDCKLHIYTNGYLLDEDKRNKLKKIKNIDYLKVSLNYIEEEYEIEMGECWAMMEETLMGIIEMKNHFGRFEIGCIDEGGEKNSKFINFIKSLGCIPSIAHKDNYIGKIECSGDMRLEYKCGFLNHMDILVDGKIALCCKDIEGEYLLGDLNGSTILNEYNSDKRKEYLRGCKIDHFPCTMCNVS